MYSRSRSLFVTGDDVQTGRRLIEDQWFGVMCHCHDRFAFGKHARGEFLNLLVQRKREPLQLCPAPLFVECRIEAFAFGDLIVQREGRHERAVAEGDACARFRVHPHPADGITENDPLPSSRPRKSEHEPECGGLAGAVGTDESGDGVVRHLHRHVEVEIRVVLRHMVKCNLHDAPSVPSGASRPGG